jgi:hypothetical protein
MLGSHVSKGTRLAANRRQRPVQGRTPPPLILDIKADYLSRSLETSAMRELWKTKCACSSARELNVTT